MLELHLELLIQPHVPFAFAFHECEPRGETECDSVSLTIKGQNSLCFRNIVNQRVWRRELIGLDSGYIGRGRGHDAVRSRGARRPEVDRDDAVPRART
eukprot:scaffold7054_cov400-Pinguiococcus_pyrenoidosus.AAC.5